MKKIPIDKIEDGMVLAKPLIGSAGNILLNEGVVLKVSMVARLRNWDIPSVTVQSTEETVEESSTAQAVEFHSEILDEVFKDVMKHPIMRIVYEATHDYFKSKLTNG
ncbi:MAG: hypothetical protein V1913_08925 [Fibrobacterota bacterium]